MGGLAEMAWKLAYTRAHPNFVAPDAVLRFYAPLRRKYVEQYPHRARASAEYYKIIDRLALGFDP